MARAYSLFNMAFARGQFLGPILGGFVKVRCGWQGMSLVLGLLCFLAEIPVALFSGRRPAKKIIRHNPTSN